MKLKTWQFYGDFLFLIIWLDEIKGYSDYKPI